MDKLQEPAQGGTMETNIPRSSWFKRSTAYWVYPLQKTIVSLTSYKFSAWAGNDRWLDRLAVDGKRQIPSQSDPTYQAFLKKEIEYWQEPAHGDSQNIHGDDEHPDRNRKLRAYRNELVSGSPTLTTAEMLRKMGPFDKALTLGHFGSLEKIMSGGVARHWTFNSITGRFTDSSPAKETAILCEDLNFASFKENEYDLIVCAAILHHIVNLDHLLAEINRALTPNGRFVVLDYIGEERFRWRPEKRKYLNGLLTQIPPKYIRYPFAGIDAVHFGRLSPFEAVTSTRIPEALEKHLRPIELRAAYGVLFPMLQFIKARYLAEDNPILDMLIQADREASAHGVQPSAVSGVFGKRT